MAKSQIELNAINEIFDDYINTFNQPLFPELHQHDLNSDSIISASLKKHRDLIYGHLTINYIQTRKQRIKMVDPTNVKNAFNQVTQPLIQAKKTRISSILNTILGDVETLSANHVICLAFDYDKYWMVYKEPGDNRYEQEFNYHLEVVDQPAEKIVNSVHYLMTEDNIQDVLNYDFTENFINDIQKQTILKASIVNIDAFLKWANLY